MFVGLAAADVPLFIPLQGKLLNSSGAAITGAQTFQFTLFDAAVGGVQAWRETRVGANSHVVTNGFFDVNLGDNATLVGVNFTYPLWLEINVSNEVLTPRMRMASAPYARTSERVFGVQTLNEPLVSLSKTSTGAGNVLDITQNAGTGADLSARGTFNVSNGAIGGVNVTTRLNRVGFIGNGSGIEDLDGAKITTGNINAARIAGVYGTQVSQFECF